MANERFKVKFGLAVGDTAATIDATTGDIVTNGDIQLGGNDIKSSGGSTAITLSGTDVAVAGDLTVTGNDIKSSSATVMTFLGPDVTLAGDLTVNGGDIKSNGGTTAISITGADATIQGNATVNGILYSDDITTTTSSATVFNTTATTVNIAGAATTVSIGANTGTTTVNNSLVADDISIATVDTTNLEVTNIKAKDGTAAATIADTTGAINITTSLQVDNIDIRDNTIASTNTDGNINLTPNGNGDVIVNADTLQVEQRITTTGANNLVLNTNNGTNSGEIVITQGANGDILITPNGTGDVDLVTDTVMVGDANATATVTTNGTGDLVLNTNAGTNAGTVTLANGANGNITLAPNGTGNVAFTFNNGGNITNNRNYLFGAIRNSGTQSRGNMWELLAAASPTQPFQGLSVDNSADTTKLSGLLMRNYSNTLANRSRLIFERARGTAASATAVTSGDFLGEVCVTGTTGANTWINDNVALVPGFFGFNAAENWANSGTTVTNSGTLFTLSLQPTATNLATGSQISVLQAAPQGTSYRADVFAMGQGKTSAFTSTGSSISTTTLTIGTVVTGTVAVGQVITGAGVLPGTYIVANISGSGSGSTWTVNQSQTVTSTAMSGQTGFLGAPGNTSVDALNNLRLLRNTIQGSGGTTQIVTSSAGATLELRGDNIQLENAAGSALTSAGVSYTRTYGEFAYANAAGFAIAAQNTIYAMPLDTTLVSSGTSISNTSRINVNVSGFYKIFMSLQSTLTVSNQPGQFDFWLRKNGVDVANSKTQVDLLKDQKTVTSMHWLVESDGNDYWEIMYVGTTANYADIDFPTIAATTTPYVSPVAPALLVNVIPVGM